MTTLTAREAQNKFGCLIDKAQKEPVIITRHARPVVVVLSSEDYERLQGYEDEFWAARAREAAKSGFLGASESTAFLEEILNADTESE